MKGLRFWQWYTTRWAALGGQYSRSWVKEKYLPFRGWTRR